MSLTVSQILESLAVVLEGAPGRPRVVIESDGYITVAWPWEDRDAVMAWGKGRPISSGEWVVGPGYVSTLLAGGALELVVGSLT